MSDKLHNVEADANNYIHPAKHSADMITINDIGNNFSSGNVEDVLEEVGTSLSAIANVIIADGTGTAITLNMPSVAEYTTNMKLTFIVKENNNGNATTININDLGAKDLYKPNTTDAPSLKSGKAYEVWYDGTIFFLKASASGDASPSDVLAGKTFSNDDGEQVGTKDLSNLVASNVKDGVNISGVVGTLPDGTGKMKYAHGVVTYRIVGTYNFSFTINTDIDFSPSQVFVEVPHIRDDNDYYLRGYASLTRGCIGSHPFHTSQVNITYNDSQKTITVNGSVNGGASYYDDTRDFNWYCYE
jgi:hypothetical protein